MTVRTIRWAFALGAVLALHGGACRAGDTTWHAAAPPAPPAVVASAGAPAPAAGPAASLGRPIAVAPAAPGWPEAVRADDPAGAVRGPWREAGAGAPYVVRAQAPPPDPPPPPPAAAPLTGPPPVPPPAPAPALGGDYNAGVAVDRPLGHSFWDKCRGMFSNGDRVSATGRNLFQSDHCFDYLASPVSNPFFFEDPRALTEVKPIFIYQSAPSGNPIFRGGHSEFFGTQARVAITERWSLVINELGFVSLNPKNPEEGVSRDTGFAELHLGPKWTFWRSDCSRTVAAAGLTFEIPTGSNKVFQDTGNLGLDPYLSLAHSFRLPSGFGAINFMGTAGYSFGVDSERSEFFHTGLHLDYNIANTNFYPFLESNWFHYTKAGRVTDLGFEGADLVNFGSRSLGDRDYVTLAPGLRYKFNENLQTGVALEFPLTNQKELADFRVTLDFIFRY